jgi:hypothetical protein
MDPEDLSEVISVYQKCLAENVAALRGLCSEAYRRRRIALLRVTPEPTQTFAALVETLKRCRSVRDQTMRVGHITVSDGSQAIVGDVANGGEGSARRTEPSNETRGFLSGASRRLKSVAEGEIRNYYVLECCS